MLLLQNTRVGTVLSLILVYRLTWTNAIGNQKVFAPSAVTDSSRLDISSPTAQTGSSTETRSCQQVDCAFAIGQTFWPWNFVSTVVTTALLVPVVTVYNDGVEVTNRYTRYGPEKTSSGGNYYEGPFPTSVVNGITFTYPTGLVALNTLLDPSVPSGCPDKSNDVQKLPGLPDVPELHYLDANLTYAGEAEPTPTQPPSSVLNYLRKIPSVATLICDTESAGCTASARPIASAVIPQSTLTRLTTATAHPVRMTVSAAAAAATKFKRFNDPLPTTATEQYESVIQTPEPSLGQGSEPPAPPSSTGTTAPASTAPASIPPATTSPAPDPPASTPPASTPPASTPPASTPLASTPPASTPPASTPPASTPPASTPPASTPPASTPPASTPPASTPPASTPPASTPPASTPPASTPPASTPPASTPPASTPLTSRDPTGTPPPASIPYSSIDETESTPAQIQHTGGPGTNNLPSVVTPTVQQSPDTSAEASRQETQQGPGQAPNDGQPSQSTVSGNPPDSAQGDAAPNTSPAPALIGFKSQNPTQPERTRFASLPALSSAMAEQDSSPPTLVLGSQTLAPGGMITVDNTPISLATGGSAIVANGETIAIGPSVTAVPLGFKMISINSLAASSNPSPSAGVLTLDGQRLSPASVITIDNTPISLPTGGSTIIVGSETIPLGPAATGITIGSQQIPISPQSPLQTALGSTPHALTLNGEKLSRGGVVTIDNTPVSLPSAGSALIVDGKTVAIGSTPTGVTIGSQIVSITPNVLGPMPTTLVLKGQTLRPGGSALTISSGVEVSLPATGTDVVLISGTSTIREGLGQAILSGLGIAPTGTAGFQAPSGSSGFGTSSNNSAMAFTGGGGKGVKMRSQELWVWEAMTMLGSIFGLWWL